MFKEKGSVQTLEGVTAAIVVLMRALDRTRARMASKACLTGSEVRVLFRIAEAGQATPTTLATSTDLSVGALTAISDRLVSRDIVCRATNPHDRRSLFLELTPTGHALMDGMYTDFRALIGQCQSAMSQAEQAQLETQLQGIAGALLHDLDGGGSETHALQSAGDA